MKGIDAGLGEELEAFVTCDSEEKATSPLVVVWHPSSRCLRCFPYINSSASGLTLLKAIHLSTLTTIVFVTPTNVRMRSPN